MTQLLQRAAAVLLFTGMAGVLSTSSCVDNESSIFIRACLALPSDSCTVTPDSTSATLFEGALDPGQADFHCPLLVGNQLVARGDPKLLRTETSRVELQSAVVTIYNSTKTATYNSFTVPASGFVDPGTSSLPGFGAAYVEMLDRVTARAHVGETVLAGVVIQGRKLGGIDVKSAEWTFPIVILHPEDACNLTPCFPNVKTTDIAKTTCHPGTNDVTDCRQGCVCLAGAGDCAPIGCVRAHKADLTGFCGACVTNDDCTTPTKCITTGKNAGFCQ